MRCVDWNVTYSRFIYCVILSHLAWGAWIEMQYIILCTREPTVAPRMRCVDWNLMPICNLKPPCSRTSHEVRGLKLRGKGYYLITVSSHLAWGAWIEISVVAWRNLAEIVAPRMRCVDWNRKYSRITARNFVAPRMRCVDWNPHFPFLFLYYLGRTSHEVRGLKWSSTIQAEHWWSRTSHEVRGLKLDNCFDGVKLSRRTSHEVRGLKFFWS